MTMQAELQRRWEAFPHQWYRAGCRRGHPFTPDNTTYQAYRDGRYVTRVCRTCHAESERRRLALGRSSSPAGHQSTEARQ